MSHTRGPWTLLDREVPVIVAGEGTVAVLSTGTLAGSYPDDQINANAHLIAAAPDLLALVKRFAQWDHLDGSADGAYWRREIAAVIAKAESQ